MLAGDSTASTALTAHLDVVIALLGAFATFSAFGIAIAGFLAAGGVVPTVAAWWSQHGSAEAQRRKHDAQKAIRRARRRSPGLISAAAATITVMAGISGAGLLFSYYWFRAYADGSAATMNSEYHWLVRLFIVEIVLLIGTTVVTVWGAAWSAWNTQRSANKSEDVRDKIEKAARDRVALEEATAKGA